MKARRRPKRGEKARKAKRQAAALEEQIQDFPAACRAEDGKNLKVLRAIRDARSRQALRNAASRIKAIELITSYGHGRPPQALVGDPDKPLLVRIVDESEGD